MNSQDLRDAAKAIAEAANSARARANRASTQTWAALHRGVALQLQDRAEQVNAWAAQADHAGKVTPDMEVSTRVFLNEAGL